MAIQRILNSDGVLDGDLVRAARKALRLTQQELADKTGLTRGTILDIENTPPNPGRSPETLRILHHTFKIEMPNDLGEARDSHKELAKHLTNRSWWGYHYTHDEDGKKIEIGETHWHLSEDFRCEVESMTCGKKYTGEFRIEGDSRIVCTLDCTNSNQERVVWRCPLPQSDRTGPLPGAWFGIDQWLMTSASVTLLARTRLDDEKAKKLLEDVDESFMIRSSVLPAADFKSYRKWSRKKISDAISSCKGGSTIDALSTYFSDDDDLVSSLEDLTSRRFKKTVTVRILLMDFRNKELIKARSKNRSFSNASQVAIARTKQQADAFLELSKISSKVDIQVRFYDSWPPGKIYRVDGTVFFGIMSSKGSAISGPLLVFNNPDSLTFIQMNSDFESMWDNAVDAESVLAEEEER